MLGKQSSSWGRKGSSWELTDRVLMDGKNSLFAQKKQRDTEENHIKQPNPKNGWGQEAVAAGERCRESENGSKSSTRKNNAERRQLKIQPMSENCLARRLASKVRDWDLRRRVSEKHPIQRGRLVQVLGKVSRVPWQEGIKLLEKQSDHERCSCTPVESRSAV